jgi:hypothetical protein
MLQHLRALLGRRRPEPHGTLPWGIYLTTGSGSSELFPAGPIDPLAFYERRGVAAHAKVEFLSTLAHADRVEEGYQPFGLIRYRPSEAQTLVRPQQVRVAWATLSRRHGLRRVPDASALAPRGGFRAHDPRAGGSPAEGLNVLAGPRGAKTTARGGRRIGYPELLDILRGVLDVREAIAWIEESVPADPGPEEIVHRYYLGRGPEVYLVRHTEAGRQLFKAILSAEAVEECYASGHYRRPRAAA